MAKAYPTKGAGGNVCGACSGSGGKKIRVQRTDSKGKTRTEETWQDCPTCRGSGKK